MGRGYNEFEEMAVGPDEPLYTVTVVSRLVGVPVWTLKRMEVEDIVVPKRQPGCYRLYSKRQLSRVKRAWDCMQERKVALAGVIAILEMEDRLRELEGKKKI